MLFLARKIGLQLSEEQEDLLDVITKFNISARYEDYKKDFKEKCTDEYTTKQVSNIEEVIKRIKKLLVQEK